MEDTAADLGATPWRTFRFITLPYIGDALRQASAIVFMFCFSSFGVIAILGGISRRTVESEVFIQAVRLGDTSTAISLSVLQALVILAVYTVGTRGQQSSETEGIATHQRLIPQQNRTPIVLSIFLPTAIVISPLIGVVARSFIIDGSFTLNSYRWLFNGTTEAIGVNIATTLGTSIVFAVVCAVITTISALVIARARNTNRLINSLTAFPLMTSAVTLGLGVIVTFNHSPFNWRGERWLIPVLHCVIALPLALRTLDPAVHAIPEETRQAAASLGASPWRVWRRIDLPLLTPAIRRAAGISAAISLGEFGATSFLTRNDSTTIPIAIQQLLGYPGETLTQSAFALAALCVVTFTLALRAA
jgi:thiamine transport system permease protein